MAYFSTVATGRVFNRRQHWVGIGIAALAGGLVALLVWAASAFDKRQAETQERERAERVAQEAAAKQQREERVRRARQKLVNSLGAKNVARVDAARAAVKQVAASEAARAGWLGDVDFTADIQGIIDNFQKAHALRKAAAELSALDNPSSDDRRILAEAKSTASTLERAATERAELIGKCAHEAQLIDKSLSNERADARTAEQRAELHGKLSAMLYGIEATPDTTQSNSAADAVMARVQAYREIKNQIQRARDIET
ncbi:MAG: hypothetical protein AB7G47_17630 [Mycolicibacterium sp.]|uniref:hypothetical protein n=1 Tax=Mycolicibacterium sp. TaxID=2320850 RepID=UPI003D0DC925